jgi:hypothetical protein
VSLEHVVRETIEKLLRLFQRVPLKLVDVVVHPDGGDKLTPLYPD